MKINWFSPLLPARTDIAHYTARILPALAREAEVTLWTDQSSWDGALASHARVRQFDLRRTPWPELNYADANFYNLGNNPLYHGSIWQVSRRQPGIVILHDFRLHHFFDGLFRAQWRDPKGYMAAMGFYYGEEGRRAARESYMNGARNIDRMAEDYPLTHLGLENAFGVVTHTREAYDDLSSKNRWLVAYAPLPFPARTLAERKQPDQDSQNFNLIVFGHIGRNRRLGAVLEALASFQQRERFRLDIYGEIEERQHLRSRIRKLDLKRLVHVHGFVPEAELDRALERAHLAINLRYPTMGEASGSQLRIWAHALPALVTNVGWFATLPTEAVAHVRPEHEVADIQAHLAEFLQDPARFAAMGERGRKILEEEHVPESYASVLAEIAREAPKLRACAAAYKLTTRAGLEMSRWMNHAARGESVRRVSEAIRALAPSSD